MASNFNEDDDINATNDGSLNETITTNPEYKKTQSLVDIANNTFKELCKTLENEQVKLIELEDRRKKLQEEMQRLKQEIEDEKESYRLNMVESLTDNLAELNACSSDSGGETVHEFIERQKAALEKLHSDSSTLELDVASSGHLCTRGENLSTINQTVADLNADQKNNENVECSKE